MYPETRDAIGDWLWDMVDFDGSVYFVNGE